MAHNTTAFTAAHIVPIDGDPFDGTLIVTDGKISDLGPDVAIPDDADVVDLAGQWLLPGFVDAHVHLGTHEEGEGPAGDDTNEMTDPNMAAVRVIDAINPDEIGFQDALVGGVTTVNVNPGSGNPIGGQAAAMHTAGGKTVDERVLRSPSGMKSALGENPKRVYGEQKKTPSTRLGVASVIRNAFVEADNYRTTRDLAGDNFAGRNLTNEALALVLDRKIPWRQHCHRADDVATAVRIADEFGYDLVIDHGTEAHLVADLLAERNIPVLIGPLLTSRSKVELRQRSVANPGRLAAAGVEISIITDHPVIPINFLVLQAALAVKEGLDPETALRSITINPAKVLGLDDRLGSFAKGKDADLVVWSGDPLDVYSRALQVYIGGEQVFEYEEG